MVAVLKATTGVSLRPAASALRQPLYGKASLKGLYNFEADVAACRKNWAKGGEPAAVVGSPSIGGSGVGAVLTQATHYFNTGIAETPSMTFIMEIENPAAVAYWPFGNYRGPRSAQDSVSANGAFMQMTVNVTNQRFVAGIAHFSGVAGAASANDTALKQVTPGPNRMIAMRVAEPAGTVEVKDLTTGDGWVLTTRTTGVRDICPLPILIGSNYLARDTTPAQRMFGIAIFQEALSDQEIAEYAAWRRGYWDRRDIAV